MPDSTRMKVYLEASFFGYLMNQSVTLPHIVIRQTETQRWWEKEAPKHDLFVSSYVLKEVAAGEPEEANRRIDVCKGIPMLTDKPQEVESLARQLLSAHALPEKASTDAAHIAIASVHGMDVLLTWNCRHMANRVTIPLTNSVVVSAGYRCPRIMTPVDFFEWQEVVNG